MNCIEISNIRKRYKRASNESLKGVDLSVCSGDKLGILGPNGAGKTTLISILSGILEPSEGTVNYYDNGARILPKSMRQKIGYVPQDFAFYPELTPLQNLEYFGAMYNLKGTEIESRSKEILEILGLKDFSNKKVGHFSGGMKRRVNLAIGIIHKPEILFLDEPTVGVDVQSKSAIIKFLNELNNEGMTIIYTSHHMSEAQELCNKIALLDSGKIIAYDGLNEIMIKNGLDNLQDVFLKLTGEAYRD